MDSKIDFFHEYLRDMILHAIRLGPHMRDDFWYEFLNDIFIEKNLEYNSFTKLLDVCNIRGFSARGDYLVLFGLYTWFKETDEKSALILEHILINGKNDNSLPLIDSLNEIDVVKDYLKNLFCR